MNRDIEITIPGNSQELLTQFLDCLVRVFGYIIQNNIVN